MIDLVPTRAEGVESEVIDGEMIFYRPQTTSAIYLNSTAAVIWGLCDGKRSIRQITDLLGDSYPDAGDLTEEVLNAIGELRGSGLLVLP
jgi:pyrroloquinoline quinone biosynthesis protein D